MSTLCDVSPADADANNGGDDVVEIYNEGLGNGRLIEKSMDEPYITINHVFCQSVIHTVRHGLLNLS